MSPAPRSYCELVPVRITIGFPPEREPFTTGWGKNFALEKRIYFIDRWITLPHTAASCEKSRVEGGVAKDKPMLQQTDRRCLLSGKEQFIGHIAETEPQKTRGDGKPYGPFQHLSEGLHKIIHGTVLRGHKVEGAAQLFMIE